MDTCSGDDIGYQIPIATTITFDGVEYSNIYATTNSVITFGQPDGTYWDYPSTPSISLYSMDWFPGYGGQTEGLDIYYSEGGFQINLNMVPFGNWNAEPSTVNILVAITNTGGISVAYSYQGPEYSNMRTGVRLHDGSIVSLEAWGATQIEAGEEIPTLEPEPVPEPSPSPTGPTQEELEEQARQQEEQARQEAEQARVQEEIRVVNNLLASAAGISELIIVQPIEEPTNELPPVTPEPEITEQPEPEVPILPEPDFEVEPEIITPEDPRFPDEEINTEDPATRPEEPEIEEDITEESNTEEDEVLEEETEEVIEESEQEIIDEPEEIVEESKEDILEETVIEGANLLADLSSPDSLLKLTEKEQNAVAETLGISTVDLLQVAELAESDPIIGEALQSFAEKAQENINAPMPYTLADAIVEERVEQLLSNPAAVIGSILDVDLGEIFGNLSSLGSDMTDDQREKAQEVIVPVIIASNIVAAAMTRRK